MEVKRIILRLLGSIVGLSCIGLGTLMLFSPVLGAALEQIGTVSQILMGAIFLHYGVTGKSSFIGYFKKGGRYVYKNINRKITRWATPNRFVFSGYIKR